MQLGTPISRRIFIEGELGSQLLSIATSKYQLARHYFGFLQLLIHSSNATTFDEWQSYYFETGYRRLKALESIQLESELRALNDTSGRTIADLEQLAEELHHEHPSYSIELFFQTLLFQCLDQTWQSFMKTRVNLEAISEWLATSYPNASVRIVPYVDKIRHQIDYEVWTRGARIFAISMEPYIDSRIAFHSTSNERYLRREKHKRLTQLSSRPVISLTLTSDDSLDLTPLDTALARVYQPFSFDFKREPVSDPVIIHQEH